MIGIIRFIRMQNLLAIFAVIMIHSKITGQNTYNFHPQFKYLTFGTSLFSDTSKIVFPQSFVPTSFIKTQYIIPKYTYLAFFCKLEDKIYLKTKTNVRFNLGSNSYVNYLEGKNKYY